MNSLKKTLAVLFTLTSLTISCSNDNRPSVSADDHDRDMAAAQREKDSLEQLILATLNDIDNSIDWVFRQRDDASKETTNRKSLAQRKQEILKNIELASNMLRENKARIEELETKAGKNTAENKRLSQRLAQSNARIKKYEQQLTSLYDVIADKDWEIDNLNHTAKKLELENIMYKGFADKFEDDLNTAYYARGTYSELKKSGVLTREGGLLGLGRTAKLKQDFTDKAFEKIDTRRVTSIPVNAKKAKLVTTHPEGSYEWKKQGDLIASIEIKDPEVFWKTSKHLVVELK